MDERQQNYAARPVKRARSCPRLAGRRGKQLTLHSEITLKKGDSEKNVSPLFVSDLRYAIQFDSPIDDENTPAALSIAWPYMREKLVEQLQSHDIPAMSIVPLSIAALPAQSQ